MHSADFRGHLGGLQQGHGHNLGDDPEVLRKAGRNVYAAGIVPPAVMTGAHPQNL